MSTRPLSDFECLMCQDLGILRVSSRHDAFETLMRCDCKYGKEQSWRLPQWIWDCGKLFSRGPCPLDWFKPTDVFPNWESRAVAIQEKVKYWRAKVRIAEQYWAQGMNQNPSPECK